MRDFFKTELENLEFKTGLKQYDKLMEREDWEDAFEKLMKELLGACGYFPDIPDQDKEKVIRQGIITDQDFTSFNGRIIYKWLAIARPKFTKELAHISTKPDENYKPIPVGSPEWQAWLDKYSQAVGAGLKCVPEVSQAEKSAADNRQQKGHPYPKSTAEQEQERELHRQWARENHDLQTGKPLPTWISFEKWLESNPL